MPPIAVAAFLAAALSPLAALATPTLIGDTVVTHLGFVEGALPTQGLGPVVVTADASDTQTFADQFSVDINGTSFTIHWLKTGSYLPGTAQFSITDMNLSGETPITSFTADTNLTGYGTYFNNNAVGIQLGGVAFTADSWFTGTFVPTAPVPEPASSALLAFGLGAVALVGARRTRA